MDWESDESPTGWNHKTDSATYTSYSYANAGDVAIKSIAFTPDADFYINKQEYSFSDALEVIDTAVMKQLLNPEIYKKILGPAFNKEAENAEEAEPDFYEPERDEERY